MGRFQVISEGQEGQEESDLEAGGNPSASDSAREGLRGGLDSRTSENRPQSSMMVHGDETGEDVADASGNISETTNPKLVVFKTCWAMVGEVLWKGQVGGVAGGFLPH